MLTLPSDPLDRTDVPYTVPANFIVGSAFSTAVGTLDCCLASRGLHLDTDALIAAAASVLIGFTVRGGLEPDQLAYLREITATDRSETITP